MSSLPVKGRLRCWQLRIGSGPVPSGPDAGRAGTLVMACAATWTLLAGCAGQTPRHDELGVPIPGSWGSRSAERTATLPAPTPDWWHAFGSVELEHLIDQAQTGSFDIAAAIAGVRQARLLAEIAGAVLLPEVAGSLNASRPASFGAGLQASYEVDFWGRNRAIRDGALAELRASEFDRATVGLMAISSVADAYVQTLWLRQQQALLLDNLQLAERIMKIVDSRRRAGAATQLEVTQQQGVLVGLRRSLVSVRQQERDSVATLAVLLGKPPQDFKVVGDRLDALTWPLIDAGLPSDLLARRPDIARLEAQLTAADANIAVARAAIFPSLSLGGGVATGGNHLQEVFDNPVYSLAAGLTAPIFNGRRLAASHELARVQKEALLVSYRAGVVAAFADVEIALNAIDSNDRQRGYHVQEEQLAEQTLRLSESRYRAGAEDLLTVLDAQRTLYSARETTLRLYRDRLQASISLFRALGGGWSVRN